MSVSLKSFVVEGKLAQSDVSLNGAGKTSYGGKATLNASLPEGLSAKLVFTDKTVQSVRASGGRGRAGQSARSRARGRRESAAPIVGSPARLSPRARSSSTTCRCSRRTPPWRSRRTVRVARGHTALSCAGATSTALCMGAVDAVWHDACVPARGCARYQVRALTRVQKLQICSSAVGACVRADFADVAFRDTRRC
jgi:hypothetical protein